MVALINSAFGRSTTSFDDKSNYIEKWKNVCTVLYIVIGTNIHFCMTGYGSNSYLRLCN